MRSRSQIFLPPARSCGLWRLDRSKLSDRRTQRAQPPIRQRDRPTSPGRSALSASPKIRATARPAMPSACSASRTSQPTVDTS